MPISVEMSIDYRLLPHFEASHRRHAAARDLLPSHWRSDPRPEIQLLNDTWVSLIVRTRQHIEQVAGGPWHVPGGG